MSSDPWQRWLGPLLSADDGADAEWMSQFTLTALGQASRWRALPAARAVSLDAQRVLSGAKERKDSVALVEKWNQIQAQWLSRSPSTIKHAFASHDEEMRSARDELYRAQRGAASRPHGGRGPEDLHYLHHRPAFPMWIEIPNE